MWSRTKYQEALDFAALAHGGQKVPGKPYSYVVHLVNVCMEVMSALAEDNPGLDADLAVQCALLHDVLEDTQTEYTQLQAQFGQAVARGVRALTKDKTLAKEQRMADSLQRLKSQPREVGLVKLADRITNLQPPPGHWTKEKKEAYCHEAGLIHTALNSCHTGLGIRLKKKIEEYRRYIGTELL